MTQGRLVFGDLTNTGDVALKGRDGSKSEATCSPAYAVDFNSDASKSEATCSPAYAVDFSSDASKSEPACSPAYADDDFTILQDIPLQSKDGNLSVGYSIAAKACPQTPTNLSCLQPTPLAPQQSLGQVFGKVECPFPGPKSCKIDDDALPEMVALCAAEMRDLWEMSVKNEPHRIMCLLQKFGSMGPPRLAQAFFHPPQGRPPAPCMSAWPHRKNAGEPSGGPIESLPTIENVLAARKLLHKGIDHQADGAACELVNNILRSSHLECERRHCDVLSIVKNFPVEEREKTLMWLFQVSASVNFQDSVLHMAVQLLDRFCAALPTPIPVDRLQLVTVAILSISLKMNGAVDENSKPPKLQQLLVHLTQNRFTIQEIFMAEHEVLRCLEFEVSSPTAIEFLDSFLIPHDLPEESQMPSPVRCIAKFLLQLSLLDAPLQYRYSPAVMAAGAVYVALWCTQRTPEHVMALLENLAVCFKSEA